MCNKQTIQTNAAVKHAANKYKSQQRNKHVCNKPKTLSTQSSYTKLKTATKQTTK